MTLPHKSISANFSTTPSYGDKNYTNSTGCPEENLEWIFTVMPVYILVIVVLGVVLNVFVLVVFCFHKKACTVAEIYLSNMAVADLVLVSCLPFWAANVSNGFKWQFGQVMCKLVNLAIKMNAYCSIYFLVLVSVDRYVALVHPLSHENLRRPKYAKLGCVFVWCLGLLLGIPTLIFRVVEHVPAVNATPCFLKYYGNKDRVLYEGIQITFSFIIPVLIISFCTLKIIQALHNRLIVGLNSQKREHKATTLVLAVLLAFLFCWVPFHLISILDLLRRLKLLTCSSNRAVHICNQLFIYLAFFNSVLNPILYVLVGKNFRKKVKELFKPWINKRTSSLSATSIRTNLSGRIKSEKVSS